MTDEFFYVRFFFIPKNREASSTLKAVVEVPKELVQRTRKSVNSNARETGIALDLARSAAKAMLLERTKSDIWLFDEDALWYTDGHNVIDDRACDYEEGSIRVWKVE